MKNTNTKQGEMSFAELINRLNDEATRANEMKALRNAPRGTRKAGGWTLNRGSGYLSLPKDLENTRIAWAQAGGRVYLLTGVSKDTYGARIANKANGTLRVHLNKNLLIALAEQGEITLVSPEGNEVKPLTITGTKKDAEKEA